jgi:hypothetical protein
MSARLAFCWDTKPQPPFKLGKRHFYRLRVFRPSGLQRKLHTSTLSENVNTAFKKRPDDRNALPVCNAIHLNLN